jgi:hypothetical protein
MPELVDHISLREQKKQKLRHVGKCLIYGDLLMDDPHVPQFQQFCLWNISPNMVPPVEIFCTQSALVSAK